MGFLAGKTAIITGEGIRGLTRVAATEWAKDGINVSIVCPLAWTAQLDQFEKTYSGCRFI